MQGEEKKESGRHQQQVKIVCRAGIFSHSFGPNQMIVKRQAKTVLVSFILEFRISVLMRQVYSVQNFSVVGK